MAKQNAAFFPHFKTHYKRTKRKRLKTTNHERRKRLQTQENEYERGALGDALKEKFSVTA